MAGRRYAGRVGHVEGEEAGPAGILPLPGEAHAAHLLNGDLLRPQGLPRGGIREGAAQAARQGHLRGGLWGLMRTQQQARV